MNNLKNVKDNSKGQKIIAAVYLVTAHLSDNDPLKSELRAQAINLVLGGSDDRQSGSEAILTLLGAAVLAQLISEKNASIISLEVRHFSAHDTSDTLEGLFKDDRAVVQQKRSSGLPVSFSNQFIPKETHHGVLKNDPSSDNKIKRQQKILSFINERKSAAIKDISTIFPDVSEKTIQRELGTLVAQGKITKRGDKRWSIYMAVGA
jgi:hypothetical protein